MTAVLQGQHDRQPKLLDQVRQAVRIRHYRDRTGDAYVAWIRRFILWSGKRNPRGLGAAEVTSFLSSLAEQGVSASTQNQALSALLFLYDVVLGEGQRRRHHLHETVVQRAVREAARSAGITRHATCRTLRHSFATHCWSPGTTFGRFRSSWATVT